jgi:hypothetical protein
MSKTPHVPKAISDDVTKGVLVDGLGVTANPDNVIIDGFIGPPRYESQTLVARIIFPTRILPEVIKILNAVQEQQKNMKPKIEIKEDP